jgi:hypothetical protein
MRSLTTFVKTYFQIRSYSEVPVALEFLRDTVQYAANSPYYVPGMFLSILLVLNHFILIASL